MLNQGVVYMVTGMVVVFLFLTLLVVVLKIVSFLFRKLERFFPEEEPQMAGSAPSSVGALPAVAAAIAAVTHHRKGQSGKS